MGLVESGHTKWTRGQLVDTPAVRDIWLSSGDCRFRTDIAG